MRIPRACLLLVVLGLIGCGGSLDKAFQEPGVLKPEYALRQAIEHGGGIYGGLVGTPFAAWGKIVTRAEAEIFVGQRLDPGESLWERRNELIWYIVLQGEIHHTFPAAPSSDPDAPNVREDRGEGFATVRMSLDGNVGATGSGIGPRDFGQSALAVIEVTENLMNLVVPTYPRVPVGQPATAAPAATRTGD